MEMLLLRGVTPSIDDTIDVRTQLYGFLDDQGPNPLTWH
jgi:hypothetical protein